MRVFINQIFVLFTFYPHKTKWMSFKDKNDNISHCHEYKIANIKRSKESLLATWGHFDVMKWIICNWISIYIYVYSLHVCIFLCILLWFHSESKSNGCVDKTNLVQTGMDKDMLNMAVLIYVRGRPLRMHACIHFEIEILVASLSLIQLALSTCKHFKSNTSTVEKW